MNCGNCGTAKPDGARFCGRCGSQLTYAGPDPVPPGLAMPAQGEPPTTPAYLPPPRWRRRPALAAVTVAVVVLGALAVTGWREHWPPAVFGHPAQKPLMWSAVEAPLPADAAPSPSTGLEATLSGIACPVVDGCVAAGLYINRGNYYDGLIETLSHGRWFPAPPGTPVPPGAAAGHPDPTLSAVTCLVPGKCVAAGGYSEDNYPYFLGLIETSSRGAWMPSRLSLPDDAGNDQEMGVLDLSCPAVGSCVAVGNNFYNGSSGAVAESRPLTQTLFNGTWTPAEAPLPADAVVTGHNSSLDGVICAAPGSCVAVGEYTDASGNSQGLIETLASGTWKPARAPLLSGAKAEKQGTALSGVACPAPGSCVAVGEYTDKDGNGQGFFENLRGGTWIPAKAPLPRNAATTGQAVYLSSVACAATRNCVATGNYTDTNKHTEVLIDLGTLRART
jgi:hypothetical protein